MKFHELMKQRRKELGMKMFDLAAATDISPQSLGTIERGGNCRLDTAIKIAAVLKINAIPVE